MRCGKFNPRKFAEDLMIEAWWAPRNGGAGMRVVETYCHHESCPVDERRFLEYIAHSRELQLEDLSLIFEGKEILEILVNPGYDYLT